MHTDPAAYRRPIPWQLRTTIEPPTASEPLVAALVLSDARLFESQACMFKCHPRRKRLRA